MRFSPAVLFPAHMLAVVQRLTFAALLGVFLGSVTAGHAEPFRYELVLQAPEAVTPMLEQHLDVARWRDNSRMSLSQLRVAHREAGRQIADLLATEGYFSPRIEAVLDESGAVPTARYKIDAGPRARVAAVELVLAGEDAAAADAMAQAREDWSLPVGQPFRQADWDEAKRALLQRFIAERYATARIASSRADVDPAQAQVRLRVEIDSGASHAFGELNISGLQRYPEHIVRRLSPIQPGDPYSLAQVLKFQTRLQDSGYFESVEVQAVPQPGRPEAVPVTVALREAKSSKVGLGVGFSTNTGARGQLAYDDHNLLDRGWRLRSALSIEQKQQSLGLDIGLPISAEGWRDSFGATLLRSDVQNETTGSLGLRARRAWGSERTEHAMRIEYLAETRRVEGFGESSSSAMTFGYSLTLRRVDTPSFPSRGYLAGIDLDTAPLSALADTPFVRARGRLSHFTPLGERGTLILRGELGAVFASRRQGIPQAFLFRAGGDQSVRGYAYQSIGVKEGRAIVGGRYLALGSAEYVHWLDRKWGAAVFLDAGTAVDDLDRRKLYAGYGVGVRWKSPVGPLSVDLARGHDTGKFRLHFSVGFAF